MNLYSFINSKDIMKYLEKKEIFVQLIRSGVDYLSVPFGNTQRKAYRLAGAYQNNA